MKKFIIDFIKDRSFQTTVIGGIVVLIVWTIMQWLLNILSGLDYLTALKGAIDFSETKVSITWLLIVVGLFSLLNSFSIYSVRKNLEKNAKVLKSEDNVLNILLIGTDSRNPATDRGRSDSMILVSVNKR